MVHFEYNNIGHSVTFYLIKGKATWSALTLGVLECKMHCIRVCEACMVPKHGWENMSSEDMTKYVQIIFKI
jgi:7-cyano-7-deazaguanine synthase in queuosine biosynthesis